MTHSLPLNPTKCLSMTVSLSLAKPTHTPPLAIGGTELSHVTHRKLLGVAFDERLDFSRHVQGTASRARRTLGFVTQITRGMPAAPKHLYTSLVLPQLEFCSAIWDPPPSTTHKKSVESIQRRAALTLYRRDSPLSHHTATRDIPTNRLLQYAQWRTLQHSRDVASIRLFCLMMGAGHPDVPSATSPQQANWPATTSTVTNFAPQDIACNACCRNLEVTPTPFHRVNPLQPRRHPRAV
ncbi:hypothetical protein ISCGN_025199 [Ixodes scapularis]